jgi:hypothetical protein
MSKTHWKKLNNPNYLGAYSLEEGADLIATIKSARQEEVVGADGKREDRLVVRFAEKDLKPMIVNATNAKTIEKLYKTPYVEDWVGKRIQIYSAQVKAFGQLVDALRIRGYIPKQGGGAEKYFCDECENEITSVGGKSAQYIADYTHNKYGKSLCSDCAKKQAKANDPLNDTTENVTNEATPISDPLKEEE